MDALVDPNECYQYLQEAKPKHVTEEPKEKLQEVLKLYERNIDILETTQIEMQLEGKLLLYGMTLPEVEDKLSEVLAEKMQLEDCLQMTTSITPITPITPTTPNIPFSRPRNVPLSYDFQIYIQENADPRKSSLADKVQVSDWKLVDHSGPAYAPEVVPMTNLFLYIRSSNVGMKIFFIFHQPPMIIGFRNVTPNISFVWSIDFIQAIVNQYADIVKCGSNVDYVEIYRGQDDTDPILTLEVQNSTGQRSILARDSNGAIVTGTAWSLT